MQCNMDGYDLSRVKYYDVGGLDWECIHCKALGFKDEIKGTQTDVHFGQRCCAEGKIDLERFPDLPPGLLHLYQSNTRHARYF